MANKRRTFSAQEKVSILRRHLVDKVPVSNLCDEYGLNPTVFYRWQKEFFENGTAAFERRSDGRERKLEAKVAALTSKLAHKDEVIAEIMEAHVALKKLLGRLEGVLGGAECPGCGGRFRVHMVTEDGVGCGPRGRMARRQPKQVPRLASALRPGERAQCLDSARLLAGGVGEGGHRRLSPGSSRRWLSPPDVHDDG